MDIERLEAIAVPALALESSRLIYLVDEIGKMECFSTRFVTAMKRLLESDRLVIATIARRGGGFIAEVKQRDDVAPSGSDSLYVAVSSNETGGAASNAWATFSAGVIGAGENSLIVLPVSVSMTAPT